MLDVLVVDADQIFSEAVRLGLTSHGYSVATAQNAQSAVDSLDQHGAAVVIAELQLPEHNGLALLQHLQSYADWQDVPVIVLSQLSPVQVDLDRVGWRQHGVVDFIHKPKLDLVELSQQLIGLVDAAPAR